MNRLSGKEENITLNKKSQYLQIVLPIAWSDKLFTPQKLRKNYQT